MLTLRITASLLIEQNTLSLSLSEAQDQYSRENLQNFYPDIERLQRSGNTMSAISRIVHRVLK